MPIFREYIGVKPYPNNLRPDFPVDIINSRISEFHFILGFATEDYVLGKGIGEFRPNWNIPYSSPENVRINLREKFRGKCDKVKVVLSIGGRDPKYPFNPTGRETWVANAIRSLNRIIADYKIDGIDIHYEHIDSSINDFTHCMGRVIQNLPAAINVVSITPSARVALYYRTLYQDYNAHIDWVDYQFYSHKVSSNDDFVKLYDQLSRDFDGSKLLVGGSTDPADAANMSPEVFIEGVRYLVVDRASLPGAFVWNAKDSAAYPWPNENPFYVERRIQAILTGTDGQ